MQLMIDKTAPIAARLSELFSAIGFPDERGRAQRIASRFDVSRETARKWLSGEALPETWRLAEFIKNSPYSADYILTGRDFQPGIAEYAVDRREDMLGVVDSIYAHLRHAVESGAINLRSLRIVQTVTEAIVSKRM
jgi:hypothetical protein